MQPQCSSSIVARARPVFRVRRGLNGVKRVSRRTLTTVRCSSHQNPHSDNQEESVTVSKRVMNATMAALTAGALVITPLSAQAVSGGGGISVPLSNQDFTGQDLRNNNYTKATLRQTNFTNCNLQRVSFFGALAKGAIFRGADMSYADLESTDLEDADMTGAILEGAFIGNTQFKRTIIDDTDWSDVVLRKDTQTQLCKIAKGTNPKTGVDTRDSLLCP